MGEQDDDIYDWMLMNSGKGWQTFNNKRGNNAAAIQNHKKAQAQAQAQQQQVQQQQDQHRRQQQHEQQQDYNRQSTKKSGGFWSKLSCGLCQ